jgi:hypothetical protein
MKRIYIAIICGFVAISAFAEQNMIALFADDVSTSSTADTVESEIMRGCVNRIFIDANVTTNDYTATIGISASNTYSGETRTLVTDGTLGTTTNLSTYPRATLVDTAGSDIINSYDKFLLHDDVLILSVSEASETNRSVRAFIYYDR